MKHCGWVAGSSVGEPGVVDRTDVVTSVRGAVGEGRSRKAGGWVT